MSVLRRVTNLVRGNRLHSDIDEELQSHMDLAVEDGVRRGLSPAEARRVAEARFGNTLNIRERTVDADTFVALEDLGRDMRHAVRQLRRTPLFTVTAVVTLAIGIGATTAVYSLIEQVMLRSLPVEDPDRLLRIGHGTRCCYVTGYAQDDWTLFSSDAYAHFRANISTFHELAAFQAGQTQLAARRDGAGGAAEAVIGQYVSGNFFRTFGVSPSHGRLLVDADDEPGAQPVAVMSFRSWRAHYGADSTILGSTWYFNGQPFTIVGIAAADFFGVKVAERMPDVWLPLTTEPLVAGATSRLNNPAIGWLHIIGRVSTVSRSQIEVQANGELQRWLTGRSDAMSADEKLRQPHQQVRITPGARGVSLLRSEYESGLTLLLFAAACVLLIACANVGNLLLARGRRDAHQTALRTALGASRFRLVRKALVESVILSLCGAVAGIFVAYAGAAIILRLALAPEAWIPVRAVPSPSVLAAAVGVSLIAGIACGILPAWVTTRATPLDAMRGSSRTFRGIRSAPQNAFVVIQVALSLVLLSAAVMLGRSVDNVRRTNLGFDTDGRYMVSINSLVSGQEPPEMDQVLEEVERRLLALPGVEGAATALYAPMSGYNWSHDVRVYGHADDREDGTMSTWARVSPGFFEAIGARIIAGRGITSADNANSRRIAVVNETFARRYFSAQSAIGKHFGPSDADDPTLYEVVGVVADMRYSASMSTSTSPMYFVPQAQSTHFDHEHLQGREVWSHYPYSIVIHALSDPKIVEADVRQVIREVAPGIVMHYMRPYEQVIRGAFSQQNMIATLSALFGATSLILASVGLYGVVAYAVEQRTGEIGVRIALGARSLSVAGMVLRDAFKPVAIGLLIGIPAAVAAGSLMTSQLIGVKPYDVAVLSIASCLLTLAAVCAALMPARRAAAVGPMRALNE